jgi:hypothetical protein
LGWGLVLPLTQPQQRTRRIVEDAYEQHGLIAAFKAIAEHQPDDFPPHWDPPPAVTPFGYDGQWIDSLEALVASDAPAWVRERYYRKFDRPVTLAHLSEDDLSRYSLVLTGLPEGPHLARQHAREIREALQIADGAGAEGRDPITERRRTLYESISDVAHRPSPSAP